MFTSLKQFLRNIVYSPFAVPGLAAISFAESSFFPIPPDTILIPLALLDPGRAFGYATVTTLASVAGGLFGYAIGHYGGKPLARKIISEPKLERVRQLYQKYDVWAVTMGAFTPLPYKVFTIAAGLMDLNVKRFILASFIGRAGRFYAIATVVFVFGESARTLLSEYFELAVIAFSVLLITGIVAANKVLSKK